MTLLNSNHNRDSHIHRIRWSEVKLDAFDAVGAHLYAGLLSFHGTLGSRSGSSGPYTDLCSNTNGDLKKCCMALTIGGISVIVFGGLFLLFALVIAILSLFSICGRNITSPTRSSNVQWILGIGVVISWSCAHIALQEIAKVIPNWSEANLQFSMSWILALASTVIAIPLACLYALPRQPESVLYQVFTNTSPPIPASASTKDM